MKRFGFLIEVAFFLLRISIFKRTRIYLCLFFYKLVWIGLSFLGWTQAHLRLIFENANCQYFKRITVQHARTYYSTHRAVTTQIRGFDLRACRAHKCIKINSIPNLPTCFWLERTVSARSAYMRRRLGKWKFLKLTWYTVRVVPTVGTRKRVDGCWHVF